MLHLGEGADLHKSDGFAGCCVAQESILAVLTSDYGQVQKLVEDAVRQLSAAAASSAVTPLDKCQLMEQMNDNHVSQLLPRLRACDEQVAAFTQRCLHDKVIGFDSSEAPDIPL